MTEKRPYDPQAIEAARQAAWEQRGDFEAPRPQEGQERVYVKPSSPFTSGNLHMGHVRDYSIGDAYARFRRARGDAVLFGFGFDAFGLPAELAAIERQEPPADWVAECGERMLGQMKRLGFSFDYDRVFYSSDEGQYRWSQWLFLTLLEAGPDLPRRRHRRLVRHLPDDARLDPGRGRALLALPQRGAADPAPDLVPAHHPLPGGERPQHSSELERLGRALAGDPALHPRPQRRGRARPRRPATRGPDRLHPAPRARRPGALRPALAAPPRGRRAGSATRASASSSSELRSGGWERSARDARSVPVVDTGASIAGPGGEELPVARLAARRRPLRADRGARHPGGRRGRPRHRRARSTGSRRRRRRTGRTDRRRRRSTAAREATRYRANDFSISRQRSWGTPIPVVHCEACGAVPVPERGPAGRPARATSSRPAKGTRWPSAPTSSTSTARAAAAPAKRETDTLDCHFDALWLWVPAAVPPEARAEQMFTHPDLREWLPSERLVAGNDSGGFVFDQRVVTKALRDIGPFAFMARGRAVRRLPLPRDGDRRRPQDEQAPRQRRQPRRAGRAATAPTPSASPSSTRPARRRR